MPLVCRSVAADVVLQKRGASFSIGEDESPGVVVQDFIYIISRVHGRQRIGSPGLLQTILAVDEAYDDNPLFWS